MSRKVDLNAPRNSQNDYKKSRNNHSFSHRNNNVSGSNNVDQLKEKAAEKGLEAAGVPKFAAQTASKYVNDDKIKAIVKFPIKMKIILVALIISAPLMALMMFTVLFSNASATDVGVYVDLVQTCSKVTVTDTGCDSNGGNCTHEYDGEVDFEDYVAGVVAGIGDGAHNSEFYHALATVVRTKFVANLGSDCQISGNDMKYVSIDSARDKNMIKTAVKDTDKKVLATEDNGLVDVSYSMACVVNNDGYDYYIRHDNDYQKVSVDFDNTNGAYNGMLNSLYNAVDKADTNYENRSCPSGQDSSGFSLIGALYLASNESYKAGDILNYYYGEVNETTLQGMFVGNQVDGFINPVSNFYKCTSSFGCRVHPISGDYRYHKGIDIPVVEGTPVYAAKSGRISAVRTDVTGYLAGSYGNYIDVDHMDGTKTRYAHLKYGGVLVSVGQMVNQGQQIALSGNTGGSTGPHLHYEVHVNGVQVDPYNYIDISVINDAGSCNYGRAVAASYCGR